MITEKNNDIVRKRQEALDAKQTEIVDKPWQYFFKRSKRFEKRD